MVTDAVAATGFPEVRLALAGMDQDNGDFGLVAVTLADHFGGGTQLAGGAIDGGSGAESAQLEFKNRRGMTVGKSDRIQLPEAVAAAEMIAQFGILIPEDATVAEFEVAGEEGANPKFCGRTDDGEGGGLDADLANALPFPPTADGETLRPAEIFPIVGMDKFGLAVIGGRRGGVWIQGKASAFFGADHAADPGIAENEGEGAAPEPCFSGHKFSVGRPGEKGKTGPVEKKAKNHQGKPTNHILEGKGKRISCKSGDRSGIDRKGKKRDSVST
jgi:hypothetical protein